MATIKLDNVAATASITIQLIKDYSMYNSEIISSNGTIFQSTDTDTTLTLRVYKGVEDITNKITDIEWKRFYFSGDELREDYSWGENKVNKQRITLYKDEVEEKSIIQANGYSIIEGQRELVTTARITIIKISDVYISDIAPIDPSDNMMWMDTNNDPPVLKLWKEEMNVWVSSGTDIPIVKNIIRNSNFWSSNLNEYYEIKNSDYIYAPEIITNQSKRWLTLRSINASGNGGGISQKIQYPITANSNYIFNFIGYIESGSNDSVTIKIDSFDKYGNISTILEKDNKLNTSITSISIPFKTLDTTKELQVYIGTKNKTNCYCHITELSLYNSSVFYPWELCPEDVDKQITNKLDSNRSSVFNTLTDNGAFRAIYESNGQYFIRSTYIMPRVLEETDFNSFKTNEFAALQTKYNELEAKYTVLESKYTALESRIRALEDANNSEGGEPTEPEQPTN
jgi:hypothetical protein